MNDSLLIEASHEKGVELFMEGRFIDAAREWERTLEQKEAYYGMGHLESARTCFNVGSAYFNRNLYGKSIIFFNKSLDIRLEYLKNHPGDGEVAELALSTAAPLMRSYISQGDYDKAILLGEDIFAQTHTEPDDDPWVQLYAAQAKRHKGGEEHLLSAIQTYTHLSRIFLDEKMFEDYAQVQFSLGNAYSEIQEVGLAEKAYLEAVEHTEDKESAVYYDICINMGGFYSYLGKEKKANKYLSEALRVGKVIFDEGSADLGYLYSNMGELEKRAGNWWDALYYYEKALSIWINDFAKYPLVEFDDKAGRGGVEGEQGHILETLSLRGEALENLGQKHPALQNYHFTDRFISFLREDVSTESSNLHWVRKTRSIYENAVRLALEMGETEQAFRFMEKSKAVLLYEHLQKTQHMKFEALPQALRAERDTLTERIAIMQRQLAGPAVNHDSLQNIVELLRAKLNDFDKEYFPKTVLNTDGQSVDVADFQTHLKTVGSDAVLFFGNMEQLTAAFITPRTITFHQYEQDARRRTDISRWLDFISQRNSNVSLSEIVEMQRLSHSIYMDLLGSVPAFSGMDMDETLFIPDGILQFVPFEALVTDLPDQVTGYKSATYLLQEKNVRYAYSASVQMTLARRGGVGEASAKPLVISPVTFKDLPALRSEEAKELQKVLRADLLEKEAASTTSFMERGRTPALIHLSTHASGGDGRQSPPWIAFHDRKLLLPELYGLQPRAQLVTLSACETARGEQIGGEGVLSLARGFSFAGVPQVVTSLWAVNESSTAEIMGCFYKNLRTGISPSQALRAAKINYLETHGLAEASPYHWSAFTAVGVDVYRYPRREWNLFMWLLGGISMVLLVVGCAGRFRK